jgi:2-polyprenyl-6-hydroxyphenyl methylase/3-demethylubiquinone-9 3-methyltransferase
MDSNPEASPGTRMTQTASTIDPREVEFYSRLAATWWNTDGPFWPLHRLNTLRAAFLRERLCELFGRDSARDQPLEGLRILDIGCGGGILSESIAQTGASVLGIDVVDKNIHIARRHAAEIGLDVRYQLTSAEELAATGAEFDVVLNMEVVEHVANLSVFMDAAGRMVRPGGVMAVATINRTLRSWLFAIVGAEYVLRWLPRGTHQWRRFPTPSEIADLMAARGLAVVELRGVRINPLTRGFSLSRSTAVNYMTLATRARAT